MMSAVLKLVLLSGWFGWLMLLARPAQAINPDELLPTEQAFRLSAETQEGQRVVLSWRIADGYYLYRHKLKFKSLSPSIVVSDPVFPVGKTKHDKFLGEVEIYRQLLTLEIPVQRRDAALEQWDLEVVFQGCADAGVCYMPERRTFNLTWPDGDSDGWGLSTLTNAFFPPDFSEQEGIAASFDRQSAGPIMLSFFGFGLLLAFTPCVFPMIPILSGIIAGQGENLTTARAFVLSLNYVLASALAYSVFGVLAGLFGDNLQLFFQKPAVIVAFSAVFIALGLSMFGIFHLQIPSFLQTRIMALSARQRGGHWLGAAAMGLLSSLAIGPCVTAPLAGALIYIGQTGDAGLGGGALFCLGLGMGLPLLAIGTTMGKWLPKSGNWMKLTQYLFGFGLLAVAVWLLGRIFPPEINRWLWLTLLTVPVVYLARRGFWRTIAASAVIYLLLTAINRVTDQQREYLQSLCVAAVACEKPPALPFQKIASVAELNQALNAAHAQKQWLMLDVYADWCVACKEMELYTFADDRVKSMLAETLLLQVDVTANDAEHLALLKKFELIGPPAVLFFAPNRQEQKARRVIGFVDSDQFLAQLSRILH